MRQSATKLQRIVFLILAFLLILPITSPAGMLMCPDSPDESHHREVTATSAPEIKVRAANQDDEARWSKIVRPLTMKAVKLAKAQRAINIEEGVEHGCIAPQVYVAQMVPAPNQASGCEHRVVTRPGEAGQLFVQVVAICKYDWSCCAVEEGKPLKTSSMPAATGSETATSSKSNAPAAAPADTGKNAVSAAPSTSAPLKPLQH